MNENDLELKYLVLKIEDIKTKLKPTEQERFWDLVSYIIFEKEDGYQPKSMKCLSLYWKDPDKYKCAKHGIEIENIDKCMEVKNGDHCWKPRIYSPFALVFPHPKHICSKCGKEVMVDYPSPCPNCGQCFHFIQYGSDHVCHNCKKMHHWYLSGWRKI